MRLTNVLNRCAAAVRAAARHVGQSLGLLGRTVTRAVRRVIEPVVAVVQPAMSAVRARLGRLARVVMPVAVVACSRPESAPPMPPPAPMVEATIATAPPEPPPIDAAVDAAPERPIGEFLMTFYYIAVEEELAPPPVMIVSSSSEPAEGGDAPSAMPVAEAAAAVGDGARAGAALAANDNTVADAGAANDEINLAAMAGPATVPMVGRDCQTLAEVSPGFAAQVRMQGTGRLRDGRLINVAGSCSCGGNCFHILPAGIKWGTGAWGLPLSPFRMVAVDPSLIKLGSLLYLPELDGRRMPGRAPAGGFIHDGCVVAADVGGGIKGRQLDLFVARRAYYDGLARRGTSHGWATSVEVWDGSTRCKRKGSKVSRSAAASI